ncbi:hypothetical protein HC341_18460 [Aquisalimonas sp. 2447]|uniref:hypothetical protein n=1 Tax=Aquisalimonas sp. 2447 TaxID=2740807 RepID=UPI0014325C3F|nr:hypothetical protein [Aquisalimonas sp. 2447]QIT57005.1 hypothetical protein HC341_18460 [Aquisalimonas sp. 2447]
MTRFLLRAVFTAGFTLLTFAVAGAEDNAVELVNEHGGALTDEEREVVEEALSTDVLQPGEYRIDVDVESRSARIIEVEPALEPGESAH